MLLRAQPDHEPRPSGARLARDVLLVAWQGERRARFCPRSEAAGLPRPLAAAALDDTALPLRAGLLRLPHGVLPERGIELEAGAAGGPKLHSLDVAADPLALAATLPDEARLRLFGFLTELGTFLFRLEDDPGFARMLRALAATLPAQQGLAEPVACLPSGLVVLRVAGSAEQVTGAHVIGARAVRRARFQDEDGAMLLALRGVAEGDVVWLGGSRPWLGRVGPAPRALPHAVEHVVAGGGTRFARLVQAGVEGQPIAAALGRELDLLARREPASIGAMKQPGPLAARLDRAIPDGAGGLFLQGVLRDPHRLVAGWALAGQAGLQPIAPASIGKVGLGQEGCELVVAWLPDAGSAASWQPELRLMLHSGAALPVVPRARPLPAAAARDQVLAAVPQTLITDALLERCIAPAASRLHAAAANGPRAPEVTRLGAGPKRPKVSVIIPLYRNLSFLRVQLAAFAADPAWAEVETILLLDSPEQAQAFLHLARGIHLMHGLPLVLAVLPRNLGYAAANNEGARLARGRHLLLLNSDVVPDRPGWLGTLLEALEADRKLAAVGPKLLFDDGSIQHAGLLFRRDPTGIWYNHHYFKGYPRGHGPACVGREVPGVTGAAILVRRNRFEAVRGFTEDYIIGDYEDSDLCLKLRGQGGRIAYVPDAELWHFERRSIRIHDGYARTLAGSYNRALHHRRWDETIAGVMERFTQAAGRAGR